jgi:TPR repeat protein
MRTSNIIVAGCLIGLALGLHPAAGVDGATGSDQPAMRTPDAARPAMPPPSSPFQAFRSGTQALRAGKTQQGLSELQFAAEQGVPAAQWKLARMYADGDGVDKNDGRAFEYFRRIVNAHADDVPGSAQSRFVANAFVSLGSYYLEGIPDVVKADPPRAREMFRYAATYFGDPDAQYNLGRLYLSGRGAPKDPVQAAKWLKLAADKGQHSAQGLLGAILFKGEDVSRQAALGLFWLTVARDGAGSDEAWIADTYASAFAQASDGERELAYQYLENWLRPRRE